jgi:hypothetical protein
VTFVASTRKIERDDDEDDDDDGGDDRDSSGRKKGYDGEMANTMMMMASSGTRPMMPRGRRCFLRLNNIMISFSKESE